MLGRSPNHVGALSNLGVVLRATGRVADAVALFRRAIALEPKQAHLRRNLGNALMALKQPMMAIAEFTAALSLSPSDREARISLARCLQQADRLEEAMAVVRPAIAAETSGGPALELLGELHLERKEPAAALACLSRVAAAHPNAARVRHNLGSAQVELGNLAAAREQFALAVGLDPKQFQSHTRLGDVVLELAGAEAALPHYREAVARAPDYAAGWYALAGALVRCGSPDAAACFERLLQLDPEHPGAQIWSLIDARKAGDFARARRHLEWLMDAWPRIAATSRDWRAMSNLAYLDLFDPLGPAALSALTRRLDDIWTKAAEATGWVGGRPNDMKEERDRIRIGYLSPNFRDHPVGHVTRSLFRAHRRDRYEVHGFSTAFRPDHPDYTTDIRSGFDYYHELSRKSAYETAKLIRAAGIDILVDLDGYMDCSSPPIMAYRPAPLQVFWLGHAGGLGLSFVDYLIADAVVVPSGEEVRYREQIVRLPHVYHCADAAEIERGVPSREECGLPVSGFVFCAFNNPQKITEETFECWMRILRRVEGASLWLSNPGHRSDLVENLRGRAARAGVLPARLVFAHRLPDKSAHFARHRLAGLFLDTANSLSASTTALDALWAGLPLITVCGDRFASRIASTLLRSLGLDDLICASLADYEDLAVALARDPASLERLGERLHRALRDRPLFDSARFVRNLEAAYEQMWRLHHEGRPPCSFDVALPVSESIRPSPQ